MTSDHYASPAFIQIGERTQQLDMLLHVQQFSSLIVLLTGDSDTGKSSLLAEAKQQLSSHQPVILFDAFQFPDQQSITAYLTQESQREKIIESPTEATQDGVQYILVDDAHLLDIKALTMLVQRSIKDESWHLVLCGDESLQEKLNKLQAELQCENLYHHIHMQPLTETESSQFMVELFKQAGQDELPLSQQKVHQLWLLSQGLPGKIIELVDVEKESRQKLVARFPLGHVAAIVLIGVALIFSFLYQDEQAINSQDVIALLLEENAQETVDETPPAIVSERASKIQLSGTQSALVEAQSKATSPTQSKQIIKEPAKSSDAHQLTSAEIAVQGLELQKKVTKPTAAVKASPINKTRSKLHPLLSAQPDQYLLQLLGVRNEKSAKAFMSRFARELNEDRLNLYQTKYKGQPWFVVVYGPFNNKNSANSEASSLGRKLKSRPWIRPVSKIQEDIRQFIIP